MILASRFGFADAACAGGAATAGVLFALVVAPACFRFVPPDSAGRVFARAARGMLGSALALALAAAAMDFHRIDDWRPFLLDSAGFLILGIAFTALTPFDRARAAALREPAAGGAVDGGSTLRSHALLRGIRALAFVGAVLPLVGAAVRGDTY